MKLVLNKCYGGFRIPIEIQDMLKLASPYENISRSTPELVAYVEAKKPSPGLSSLEVVELPDGIYFHINEYDGYETVFWSISPITEV